MKSMLKVLPAVTLALGVALSVLPAAAQQPQPAAPKAPAAAPPKASPAAIAPAKEILKLKNADAMYADAVSGIEGTGVRAVECQIRADLFPVAPDVIVDLAVHGGRIGPPQRPVVGAVPPLVAVDPSLDRLCVRIAP